MLAERLASMGVRFDKIVSSDLSRAVETSKVISKKLAIPIELRSEIRERGAGIAEGKTEDEIDWEIYETKPFPYRKHSGGESFFEVKKRSRAFLESFPPDSEGNVLVVSHSVFIAMAYAEISKISMKKAVKVRPEAGTMVYDTKKRTMEFVRLE